MVGDAVEVVVGGIHDDTADSWANAFMPVATRFTDFDVLMLFVTNHTQGCGAVFVNQTDFAAGQAHLRVAVVAAHQLGAIAGATNHLGTTIHFEFDSVDG